MPRTIFLTITSLLCLMMSASAFAQQYARPDSTVTAGNFTAVGASTLHEAVDETTANDGDYALSPESVSSIELGLSTVTDPGTGTGHSMRVRFARAGNGSAAVFRLYQGTTLIAASPSSQPSGRDTFQTFTYNLTTGEANAITDYTDLRIRVTGSGLAKNKTISISWMELEVPTPVAQSVPVVASPTYTDVTDTTTTLGGNVTDGGGSTVTSRGVEYGTSPGSYGTSVPAGSGTGVFTTPVTGLSAGSTIYFRAWAINTTGTGYSSESSFTTLPTVSAPTFADVTDTTATLGGTVTSAVSVSNKGIEWGTAPGVYDFSVPVGSGGTGPFTHPVTSLPSGTVVYFHAWAVNAGGTGYSGESSFTTKATVSAPTFSAVTDTTATLGGTVSSDGGVAVTERGTVWGTSPNPTGNGLAEGSGNGTFTHARSSLPVSTQIYFRAYAINAAGTSYSADNLFTTLDPAVAPTVTTPTFSSVTDTTAILGGNVTDDGGATVTDRGTVWGTSPNPTGNPLSEGSGTGSFTHARSDLPSGTLIYFRAYATNTVGTSYSADGSFTTLELPTVDTPTFADVTDTTANLGGTVSDDGGAAITDRGTVWGSSPNPTGNSLSEGSGTGTFSHARASLPAGTLIYFRAYATNSVGIAYSGDGSFTTDAGLPTVTTPTFSAVTDTTATLGGNVTNDGGGAVTDRGTVWGTSPNPTGNSLSEGSGTGLFTHGRTELPAGTLIYFRAYATNTAGTTYSADGSFTTLELPTVDTPTFADVTDTTTTLGGTVSDNGGTAITDRGTVWGTSPNPTGNGLSEGSGTGTFTHARTGLPSGTLVYFRAYATNSVGTSYSADGSFTTLALSSVDTPTFADVTDTTATLGGTVSDDGGVAVTDRGTVWGASPNPTGNILSQGSGIGAFAHGRTGLPAGTLIYFRAYATNSVGTTYSADGSFTTNAGLPTVDTPTFADVTDTTATLGGTVSSDGGGAVTDRGTVWGTSPNPTGNGLSQGSGTGSFTHGHTGLPAGTLIYFRAYATNTAGTAYSVDGSFTTLALPTVDTPTSADVTDTTAILGGAVSEDGGAAVTDRGTVWGTSPNPTGNGLSEGSGTGTFTHARTGLPSGTLVYFRAYATNSVGTSYSADGSFTTLPTVSAPTSADVTEESATLGGTVSSTGSATVTDRGTVWGASPNPTGNALSEGSGNGTFTHARTGLPADTLIYFRAYASNAGGTAYSADGSFTTQVGATAPTVTSPTVIAVTATTATLGGNVTDDGGDTITERGTVWGLSPDPDIATDTKNIVSGTTGLFTGPVSTLNSGVQINYRAYATNSKGTGYSTNDSFHTEPANSPASATIDNVTFSSFRVLWPSPPAGDGNGAIVVVREASAVTATPTDGVEHAFDSIFGSGQDLGTQEYAVYRGAATSVVVTGLTDNVTYHVAVFYSAGSGTGYDGINYKQSTPAISNQLTELGTAPPTVDTPTATNIKYFAADLGGTISADGGATITHRGTLWNTTGAPIVENQLSEGGTTIEAFSHTRINLPRDTTIWYRAYATNADGTSYSADASFVTASEPDVQASNIAFNLISSNSMRITWTRGNGEGSIVVIREAATGRTDPADGTDYAGNPDVTLATQLPPSSGNFVVYNGLNNAVQLYGLSQNTTYTIAVYTYAGSGAEIDYLAPPFEANQATSDLPVHNTSYGADCTDCHNHSGGGFVPRDADQEAVCVTCHNETGPASGKLNFAMHSTSGGDIDCGSCHEIHNPGSATTSTHPLTPFTTTHNESFIRSNVDKYVPTATTDEAVYQTPVTDLAIEDASASEARGICQSCHSTLSYYNHDGSGDQCHDGASGNCDPITNGGVDCLGCHTHEGNFAPSGGGSCTGCHANEQGGGARRAIVGEFSLLSHHVAGTLAESDCEVCHAQSGAGATSHSHMDGSLTLWNVDDHSANAYQLADHADPMSNSTEAAKLSQFCLDCHDNDGAAAEASPFAPFTGSGAPPEVDSTHWSGSSHNTGGVTCFGDGSGGCHGSGHGSEKLVMLAPYDVPAIDPDRSEEREDFCLNCHDSDGMSTIDVVAQYSSATNHQVTAPGPGAKINQRHDIYPADQAYSGGLVTCKNCHQQHMNTDAAPVGDPDTGLALATYDKTSTYTDDGSNLDYQDSSSDWDPTNPQGATGGPYSEPDYIQFCLACHDGTTPPGVTMSSGMGNMAILYGADNHGTVAGNTGSKTGKGKLKLPWNTQANFDAGDDPPYSYAALNCTTCHGSHGGDNIFNLKSEITVDGQALSVGGTGASYPGISGTTYVLPTSGGNQRDHYFGAWCTFCHTMDSHPGKDEEDACTGAHEHGGGSF